MTRKAVIFTGNVQGVGFRYTTQLIAKQFSVTGFVRNLGNGSVEMIVEGESFDIDALVKAIHHRMEENVDEVRVDESAAIGEFDGFTIRR